MYVRYYSNEWTGNIKKIKKFNSFLHPCQSIFAELGDFMLSPNDSIAAAPMAYVMDGPTVQYDAHALENII